MQKGTAYLLVVLQLIFSSYNTIMFEEEIRKLKSSIEHRFFLLEFHMLILFGGITLLLITVLKKM